MEKNRIQVYRFAGCEMRSFERVVLVNGQPSTIGSRAFDVLQALIERAGRVVSREELLLLVWPGLVVEENNLSVQISSLRAALGRQVIATIPGVGYRFSALLEDMAPPVDAPAARAATSASQRGNIAPFQSELFGRDADVDEVCALVERHRLVTICGAGGIGKTRLGQAVARRVAERFAGAAWLVELAPLVDPALLPATVAQTLGLQLPGKRPALDELAEALVDDEHLLVLDNCEHVVEEAGLLAVTLLERTPGVRLLATSQELLKVSYEQVYRLPSLPVPEPEESAVEHFGAIRLLVARVRALDPRFELVLSGVRDAVEICRRLDGLPLAIELAAARVPLLGLAGVLGRLDDRLHVLTGGARSGLRRHRTLRETLAWSHSLLNAPERIAFRRVGVFVGTFGLQQAQRVLADEGEDDWAVIDRIGSLVDKSLLIVDSTDPPRYRLLESARAYALEMLHTAGETAATQRRHALAIHELFQESLALEWLLPSQRRRQRFLPDLDNGRAALDWADAGEAVLHMGLAGGLAWLFGSSGQGAEGLRHCRRALARVDDDTPPRVAARLCLESSRLNYAGPGSDNLLNAQRAVDLLRPLDDAQALYVALSRLAITLALSGDCARSETAMQEMAGLVSPTWPPLSRWDLLNARDYLANELELYDEGEALAAQELELARAHDDTAKMLFALMAAEQCAASLGRYEEAVDRGIELIDLAKRENQIEHLHVFIHNLALSLAMCGRIDEALPHAARAAAMDARHESLWKSLELMALLALRRGRLDLAARVIGCSDAANAWRDGKREPVEGNVYRIVVAALENALPEGRFAELRAQGLTLAIDEATALVLAD